MPSPADTDYFAANKQGMINRRVDDLDTLLQDLRASGIEVRMNPEWDRPKTGRFARVLDPEGKAVELWQPVGGVVGGRFEKRRFSQRSNVTTRRRKWEEPNPAINRRAILEPSLT